MIKRLLPIAALLAVLLIRPTPAWACSCMQPPDPASALGQADAVFAATVTGVVDYVPHPWIARLAALWPGAAERLYNVHVTLAVSDSWKGVTATPVTLLTGQGDADCGYRFTLGGQYVIYAYSDQGELLTNICTRTSEARAATADLAYLNPLPRLNLTSAPATPVPLACLGLAAVAGLSAAAIAWQVRRKSASQQRADQGSARSAR